MAEEDWSEAKAWMRATRERIGMTQHDVAVLANLTVDMSRNTSRRNTGSNPRRG